MAKISINFTDADRAHGYELLARNPTVFAAWFVDHAAYPYIGGKEEVLKMLLRIAASQDRERIEKFWRIVVEEDWDAKRRSQNRRAGCLLWGILAFTILGAYGLFALVTKLL